MRFILTLIILSLIFPSVLPGIIQAQTRPNSKLKIEIPKLVARVNGVDIESKYIEFRLSQIEKLALKTAKRPLTVEEKNSIVKGLIEKEVVRELVNQQGEKENLKIEPELIEKELKTLRALYTSEEEFNNAMKSRNINLEEIKKAIQIDINKNHLLNAEIKGKINPPSDEEVKKFYEDNKSRFQRPEAYHTRHILAAYFPPEAVRNQTIEELKKNKEYFARIAEEKIDKVIEELKKGADFEKLAKNLSDDESSRENGGDLEFNYKGSFETSFNEAIEKLNPGETSEKIKTRFGFHVIQLIEKRPSEMAPFTEMKPEIQKYLYIKEAKKKVSSFIEKLKQTADIQTFF